MFIDRDPKQCLEEKIQFEAESLRNEVVENRVKMELLTVSSDNVDLMREYKEKDQRLCERLIKLANEQVGVLGEARIERRLERGIILDEFINEETVSKFGKIPEDCLHIISFQNTLGFLSARCFPIAKQRNVSSFPLSEKFLDHLRETLPNVSASFLAVDYGFGNLAVSENLNPNLEGSEK